MAKHVISKADWKSLRKHQVAFKSMNEDIFDALLEAIYSIEIEGDDGNPSVADRLMMYLAHAEPPILV